MPPSSTVQTRTWQMLRLRLRSGGRIMAHIGPMFDDEGAVMYGAVELLNAMQEAFDGAMPCPDCSHHAPYKSSTCCVCV